MALTPHSALRARLTTHLFSLGGSARRRDVLSGLEESYRDLWSDDDLLPQNTRQFETKWRNRVSFEWQRMVNAGLLESRADGIWSLTEAGRQLGTALAASPVSSLDREVARRERMWDALAKRGERCAVVPERLREVGIYAGARGIYVDVETTRLRSAPDGLAVCFLDLGVKYSNAQTDRGVIYHFPKTQRPGRDAAETRATRRAYELGVPVFVVTLADGDGSLRAVHRGYIEEIDEAAETALITYVGDDELPPAPPASDSPFTLTDERSEDKWARRRARPNQARFAFKVFQRYGMSCSVCGLGIRSALEAAHLKSKSTAGSDDERNGLPLCANHHRMFDSFLWAIRPGTLEVVARPQATLAELGITRATLSGGTAKPHSEALEYAWRTWLRKNRVEA